MIPARIRIGFKNRTIPAPAQLAGKDTEWGSFADPISSYEGPVAKYDFLKQWKNFTQLNNALVRNGIKFTQVSAIMYDGDRGYNQRFVVLTSNPSILWYKYVGFIAQSGQNHIFIHGKRIKVSMFLAQPDAVQDALLQNNMDEVDRLVKAGHLKWLDEQGTLWN